MPIPNVSSRNYTTLHHLYPVPSECQRDFVRENKESVRDKSKQQSRSNGKRSNFQGNSKECLNGDSSISALCLYTGINRDPQQRPQYSETQQQYPLRTKQTTTTGTGTTATTRNQKSWSTHNATNMKNPLESVEGVPQKSKSSPLQRRQISTVKVKHNPPKKTSTIGIQTDEIQDEIYLYSALKKCASPAFKAALKAKYQQKDQIGKPLDSYDNQIETKENFPVANEKQTNTKQIEINTERYGGGGIRKQFIEPQESESEYPLQLHTGNSRKYHYDADENLVTVNNGIGEHWNVMTLPVGMKKICNPNTCANCPNGYHLINDEERLQIKLKLLEHEALLIRQLNSFPLAIETLRVRQSKTRIEKELSILEQNLRKLTKKKVYAKLNE